MLHTIQDITTGFSFKATTNCTQLCLRVFSKIGTFEKQDFQRFLTSFSQKILIIILLFRNSCIFSRQLLVLKGSVILKRQIFQPEENSIGFELRLASQLFFCFSRPKMKLAIACTFSSLNGSHVEKKTNQTISHKYCISHFLSNGHSVQALLV